MLGMPPIYLFFFSGRLLLRLNISSLLLLPDILICCMSYRFLSAAGSEMFEEAVLVNYAILWS